MATDVNVQYFSHLNGLTLGNNWGDLIRLLDITLVNGKTLPSITAASIDTQGDVHLTFFAAHQAMLLQVVEIEGFAPVELNQKYRIKGVPSNTQLILKPKNGLTVSTIATTGTAKLASLDYEIIFRDVNDVKRVYRAKNPTAQHPFIRVDETISDGINSYASTYAKSAMIGLIENMTHIDDYQDSSKLQLPLDTGNFAKNWKITGAGSSVVRGWSKWYWARSASIYNSAADNAALTTGSRKFTICGDSDAFYFLRNLTPSDDNKFLSGCGLFDSVSNINSPVKNWFLMASVAQTQASNVTDYTLVEGGLPLCGAPIASMLHTTKFNDGAPISSSDKANPILPDYRTGDSALYESANCAALGIPFFDTSKYLRGNLKHVYYAGNKKNLTASTPILSGSSMYAWDCALVTISISAVVGGVYFYLGELE